MRVRGPAVALDHDQAAIDLLPPVHPRGILLADEAALGEADAVQFRRIAFEPEQVAELGAAFADAEAQAVLQPAVRAAPPPAPASAGPAPPGADRRRLSPLSIDQWTARPGSRAIVIGRRSR